MVAVTTWQQALLSIVEWEVIYMLRVMVEACARDFVHAQFESDSQLLVNVIQLK
jgi:hypothetical protein